MLTSGGCFIDQCQLLLHQLQHDEIWYVVRKLGAGRVAMLWERLLEEKTLSDVVALNETMSLTWLFQPRAQPGHPTTQQPAEFDVWRRLQPELGGHPSTQQPAESDVWLRVQPELGWHPATQQPAEFDVWLREFNQSLEGIQLPSSLQSLTFG